MRIRFTAAMMGAGLTLAACSQPPPPPPDQITEIEVQRSGDGEDGFTRSLAVETHGEGQYAVREGARIRVGDRLWEHIDRNDLLIEYVDAREGDAPDFEHEGEENDDPPEED